MQGGKWRQLDSGREGLEDAKKQQQKKYSNKTRRITQRHTRVEVIARLSAPPCFALSH